VEYEARYNLVLDGAVDHSFDVHQWDESSGASAVAGAYFDIHHNTFLGTVRQTTDEVNGDPIPAFHIRAVPSVLAWVHHNEFRHATAAQAIEQSRNEETLSPQQNLPVEDNSYGVNAYPAWFVSYSGQSFWTWRRFEATSVRDVLFGDFDADGGADAFRRVVVSGTARWQRSANARLEWAHLNSSSAPSSALALGDFNGDGRSDVFYATGSEWRVSYSGTSAWTTLNTSTATRASLAFHDFNGDGRTDVFRSSGGKWSVSYGGTSSWVTLNTQAATLAELAFGDFNGDGRADVFRATGSAWQVSWGGTTTWRTLNSSLHTLPSLRLGDFNGDGITDGFRADGVTWKIARSGTGTWQDWNASSLLVNDLAFADVNGDGKTDVLARRSPPG